VGEAAFEALELAGVLELELEFELEPQAASPTIVARQTAHKAPTRARDGR
jgi:hypothetical protein